MRFSNPEVRDIYIDIQERKKKLREFYSAPMTAKQISGTGIDFLKNYNPVFNENEKFIDKLEF